MPKIDYLTVAQAAERLAVSPVRVRQMIAEQAFGPGDILAVNPRFNMISRAAVERLAKRRATSPRTNQYVGEKKSGGAKKKTD